MLKIIGSKTNTKTNLFLCAEYKLATIRITKVHIGFKANTRLEFEMDLLCETKLTYLRQYTSSLMRFNGCSYEYLIIMIFASNLKKYS